MLAMQSFIFLRKPCICPTESSEVKQLCSVCHSAHLFWDQSWHAGTVQLHAQLGLGAPGRAGSGAWHGPAAPSATLHHLPPPCAELLLVLSQLAPHHGQSDTDRFTLMDFFLTIFSLFSVFLSCFVPGIYYHFSLTADFSQ